MQSLFGEKEEPWW